MKKTVLTLALGLAMAASFSSCGGGGGGGSYAVDLSYYDTYLSTGDYLQYQADGTYYNTWTGDTLIYQGGGIYYDTWTGAYVWNVSSDNSKDVDLEKAGYEQKQVNARAEQVSNKFGMSFESAVQLTQLADQVKQMTVAGKLTEKDRTAVTKSALAIAGVSIEQLNSAVDSASKGDAEAGAALLEKAATNMGMSGGAALRDQLLPSLGVSLQ